MTPRSAAISNVPSQNKNARRELNPCGHSIVEDSCPDPGKNEDQSCPEGEIVGAYHIHPQGTESHPSELDMEFVENNNIDLYTYYAETETLSVLDANEEVCKQVAP